MADLYRQPHRFGDPGPGWIDNGARWRARDEDPRQIEQQRRVLVAARIETGQRRQQFAAADIGVADQIEGGVGRDKAAPSERAQQMPAAFTDHKLHLGKAGRAPRRWCGFGVRVLQVDRIQ